MIVYARYSVYKTGLVTDRLKITLWVTVTWLFYVKVLLELCLQIDLLWN